MTSYWLAEKPPQRPSAVVDDPDVVVVGAGVTGCAAALRLAQAGKRVRVLDARDVAEGASGRNGGFALRGMPAPFDVTAATVGGRGGTRANGVDGARDRHDRVACGRRLPPRRLASDRRRRGGARRAPRRVRGARGRRLRGRVGRRLRRLSQAASPARCCTCRTASFSRRAGCDGWQRSPPRRAPRSASTSASGRATTSTAPRWSSHRRLSERPARATRGADRPDARPGDRDRARRAALRVPALRPPRLRLLAADAPTAGSRRRLPRLALAGEFTADEGLTTAIQDALRGVRRARRAARSGRLPLGRDLRAGAGLPPGRRPRAGRDAPGSPAATRATATCSASCGELAAQAISGARRPSSPVRAVAAAENAASASRPAPLVCASPRRPGPEVASGRLRPGSARASWRGARSIRAACEPAGRGTLERQVGEDRRQPLAIRSM